MSKKFQLSCESTVDFPFDYVDSRSISVLFYSYMVDGQEYVDNMGREEGFGERFFQMMTDGVKPVTSQINIELYREYFEKLLEKGDVLHFTLGSGLTNSYSNARLVAQELNEKYSDRKVVVVDSMCGCCGYGILVDCAADLRDRGESLEAIVDWSIANRQNVNHMFFSTDLSHLKKCGRISGITAFVGTVLGICPLFYLDYSGHIVAGKKARGFKRAMIETIEEIKKYACIDKEFGRKYYVCHSNCMDKALETREKLCSALGFENQEDIKIYDIGTVIGSHCGPGTVAIFFMGNVRP